MESQYNLIEEPFVVCTWPDGSHAELGLRETLLQAHEIREIRAESPLVTVAMHRLLLAVLHRVFGPASHNDWSAVWQVGRFDSDTVSDYLNKWHDRFFLVHPEHPFYQVAGELDAAPVSVNRLALVQANNATLFNHRIEADATQLSPAQAARDLVAYQAFAIGGGVSQPFYFSHSPLAAAGGYLVLALGDDLFETLCLNAVNYTERQPIPRCDGDPPLWERNQRREPRKQGTVPDGYLDYLTWPSRRIRLLPDEDSEQLTFSRMKMLQGLVMADVDVCDPMAAYVSNDKGEMVARPLREGRALWRDSHTILGRVEDVGQGKQGQSIRPPETLSQLGTRYGLELIDARNEFRMAVIGLCSDRAKISFWRHETLPLPLAYLEDDELLSALDQCIGAAEQAGRSLSSAVRRLAERSSVSFEDAKPDSERVAQFVKATAWDTRFWPKLENPFRSLLVELPGPPEQLRARQNEWREEVCQTARTVFQQLCDDLGTSPRILKAIHEPGGAGAFLEAGLRKAAPQDTQPKETTT
jgi:CRISPR system Cascade subunit CasA